MMRRRSSSSTTPKASKPLISRTNESTVHPIQTRKTTKKPSGISRLSFRRLSKTSRQRGREEDDDGRRPTEADRPDAEKSQSQSDLEDEGGVQYIDLDVVVMASPGTHEATSEGPLEPDREASVSIPASGERGGLERSLDEELVENSATTLRPRVGDEPSVEGQNDSAPSHLLSRSSPATPPRRSSRDDGPPDSAAASSPHRMSDSPTATYRLPDSLRKRRRGSGQRILWRDSSEGRSPSPPGDGGSDEWVHVQTLGWEEQLAAFWTLLYPNQPRSVVPLAAAAQGPPLRSWYDDVWYFWFVASCGRTRAHLFTVCAMECFLCAA
jgi:hypothetical protein